MTVLAQVGLVEVLPGSGVYLRNSRQQTSAEPGQAMSLLLMTEQQNVHDVLELRVAIAGEAAYLAAQRRTPEQAEKLKAACQGCWTLTRPAASQRRTTSSTSLSPRRRATRCS